MDGFATRLEPLPGGFSGETYLAEAAGERSVVRVYAERGARRGPEAPETDAAVMRLVRGLVPVPEVLEVRRPDPATGAPGLLVTSFVPGDRLEVLLPGLPPARRAEAGRRCGELAARLACMPFPAPGELVGARLELRPLPPQLRDLPAWTQWTLDAGMLDDWPRQDRDGLLALADAAQDRLDTVTRTCLVHSDLNAKNLLVDPETLRITALVDWEFAHAGLPGADLGNLLRFERDPSFTEAALAAYAERVPDAGEDLLERARAADLYALVELAARRDPNPVVHRARATLLAAVRSAHPA